MVRNVILVEFRPGTKQELIDAIMNAIKAMDMPGLVNLTWGNDLGLREDNMSFAAVYDFEDEEAYLAFDRNEEHARIRRELLAPIALRAERCQYRI